MKIFAVSFFRCDSNNTLCSGFSFFPVKFNTEFSENNNLIFDFSINFFDFSMKWRCFQLNVISENRKSKDWKTEIQKIENSNFLVDFNFF